METLFNLLEFLVTVGGKEPRQVARTTVLLLVAGYLTGRLTKSVATHGIKKTLMFAAYLLWKHAYQGQKGMDTELLKARAAFEESFKPKGMCKSEEILSLPEKGWSRERLLTEMKKWSDFEKGLWKGDNKGQSECVRHTVSGAVYHGGEELQKLQNEVYGLFSLSNQLHPDLFPFVRKMESEIIAMVISLFGGDPMRNCGLVTSGGTESILIAIRAYKRQALAEKGIHYPELVVATSAHVAFEKACDMFGIKLVSVPLNPKTWTVDASEMRKYITRNTIAIVGSAVCYAQGTMDPIWDLSRLAIEFNIGLHVDSCLGSFQIAMLRRMNWPGVGPFAFECPGVTSISCDTHKFGFSVKGTSVIMFRDKALKRHTYHIFEDASIGMYATVCLGGSRPGGLVAATWAALMNVGVDGYQKAVRTLVEAADKVKRAIVDTDGVQLMGAPPMSVVAYRTTNGLDLFQVSGALKDRGWALNNCQNPNCTHICITMNNYFNVDNFARDLQESIDDVRDDPQKYAKCTSAMYGALVEVPDSSLRRRVLEVFLDAVTEPLSYGADSD